MIRDLTLGQYYPADSALHRMDPRVKIVAALIYIIALFVVDDFVGFGICVAVLVLTTALSKVPLSYMLRGIKPILFIIAFTFFLNLFMTDGDVVWQWHFLKITEQSIYRATYMALRLIFLILGSNLLTLTTKPLSLTDGIESLLSPFKRIGLPAHELAMMMSIALRFIPTLLDETDKIMKAQQARGADFESGGLMKRAKNMIPILVPLFIGAFRIAQDLAMAMESRCYRGGEGRTRMHPMKMRRADYAAVAFTCVFMAAAIAERVLMG